MKEQERLLKQLAHEVIEALTDVRTRRQALDEGAFARVLSERQLINDLVTQACQSAVQNDRQEIIKPKSKEISDKVNVLSDELRHLETQARDIEDAFKELAGVLASLAYNPDQPEINKHLKELREDLRRKAVAGRLAGSAQKLKKLLFKMETNDDGIPPDIPAGPPPENVEDNLRDVLILLVTELGAFEDADVQSRAKMLARKIASEFILDEFKAYVTEIQDLIFTIKDLVRRERQEIYRFTEEVISRLDETEQDLVRTLDDNRERLVVSETAFHASVAGDMLEIERSFDLEDATLETVRSRVFARIATLRDRFRKKRTEDEARLKQIEEEKTRAEKRFEDIHSRYLAFARKSKEILVEMEKFRQASLKDGLTGVYNRRAYDIQMEQALSELKAGRLTRFGLIVFDIDNFKDFNNNYGHRAGDKILQYIAGTASDGLRQHDFVARYGGDEFALILPEADTATTASVAEKIRATVAGIEFKIYRDQDLTVRVGLSMGVCEGRTDDTADSVFLRADKALYLAKEKGRNQVRTERDL